MKIFYILQKLNNKSVSAQIPVPTHRDEKTPDSMLAAKIQETNQRQTFVDIIKFTAEEILTVALELPQSQNVPTYEDYENYRYYYMFSGENTYVVVANTKAKDGQDELPNRDKLNALFNRVKAAATPAELQELINDPEKALETKLDKVRKEIDQATAIAKGALDKVIERGEKIEKLVLKTEDLDKSAIQFKNRSIHVLAQQASYCYRFWKMLGYYPSLTPLEPSTPRAKPKIDVHAAPSTAAAPGTPKPAAKLGK